MPLKAKGYRTHTIMPLKRDSSMKIKSTRECTLRSENNSMVSKYKNKGLANA